jgi:hypothetical protein
MQPTCRSLTLEDLEPEDHLCFLFNTEQEKRLVVLAFVKLGLQRTEKVIYVKDACRSETIMEPFNGDDLDAEHYASTGQLRITDFAGASMHGSVFDPDRMLRLLQNETEIALAEGWHGLRIAIEMTWALKGLPGSSRLVEFESKSNTFYCRSRCLAMCLYDLRYFSPLQLLYVLATHPTVIFRGQVCDNIYYRIPQSFIARESASRVLNDWLDELGRRSRGEVA